MSIIYQNGLGDTLGDILAVCRPLYSTGNVWYVNSAGGVDAASPAGQNREKPLATWAQAVTNAAAGDIIELMSGHTETFVAQLAISKALTVVGGGSSGGRPTVKINFNDAATSAIAITVANVELRNIWFTASLQNRAAARISVSGAQFRMIGCYTECGAFDIFTALSLNAGADSARVVNSTFVSIATVVTAQPESAVKLPSAVADLELDGLVLSGGTVGFSNYRAFDASAAAITRLRAVNVSLLLGADLKLNAASTGYLNTQTVTGGSRVDW